MQMFCCHGNGYIWRYVALAAGIVNKVFLSLLAHYVVLLQQSRVLSITLLFAYIKPRTVYIKASHSLTLTNQLLIDLLKKTQNPLFLYMITAARLLYVQTWKDSQISTMEEWIVNRFGGDGDALNKEKSLYKKKPCFYLETIFGLFA